MRIIGNVLEVEPNDHLLLDKISAWYVDRAYGMDDTVVKYGSFTRRFKGTKLNDILCGHFYPDPLEHYQNLMTQAQELVEGA